MLLLAGVLAASPADARLRRVVPGEMPELAANEGLLVVAVDTETPLYSARLKKDGRVFGSGVLRRLPEGRSHALFRAEAGTYQWTGVELVKGLTYTLRNDPEFRFTVEAGQITYPGDLLFDPGTLWYARVMVSNRGLASLDWLQEHHPALLTRHEFVFSGNYPDPFPAFYRDAQASQPRQRPPSEVRLRTPGDPGSLPLAPEELWRPERVQRASISPDGRFLALQVREAEEDWRVNLVDLASGEQFPISRAPWRFRSIAWSGDRALVLAVGPSRQQLVEVIQIRQTPGGEHDFEQVRIPRRGVLVDVLPNDPDHILLASRSLRGALMVHRVNVRDRAAANAFQANLRDRINRGVESDQAWFTDGHGQLRVAVAQRGERRVLMHGADGDFREVLRLDDDLGFEPMGLSFDANLIYGVTDRERGQRDLIAFDVRTGQIEQTLFTRPGVDVVAPVFDRHREPIGVAYYSQGRLVSEYFGEADNHLAGMLRTAFPGRTTAVASRDRAGGHQILWVDGADRPPQLYHLDVRARRASLIAETMPWLEGRSFAPVEAIPLRSGDDLPLDAFLALPAGAGPHPLVVFPHGGPIGVADTLHFDPQVQFLASLGYAVLQVNFRGSDGYGREFREAGHRQFGMGIEDDIDAAIAHVLERYPLDASRMCMLGSSYGGYSSLVAAVRWPERFRCAVSIAGVSDGVLLFTASDIAASPQRRAQAEQVIGDPATQLEEMLAISPLYHYQGLRTPVMLAHGLRDLRVDFEHTRRLLRMLDMAGRTPVGLVFEDEGHSFDSIENEQRLWRAVAAFLREHLGDPLVRNASPAP